MRGFDSQRAKEAALIKKIKNLQMQVVQKDREIAMWKGRVSFLDEILRNTKKEAKSFKKKAKILDYIHEKYETLYKYIQSIKEKSFPEEFTPLFSLFSMNGEFWCNLLNQTFGFPCYRTCLRKKNQLKEKYEINPDLYNGSLESIRKIMNIFLADCDEKRVVIAIDAAAVTPMLSISKKGVIYGLNFNAQISQEIALELRKSIEAFHTFYQQNVKDITKNYFVIFCCPLFPHVPGFPLVLRRSSIGNATNEIEKVFLDTISNLKNLNYTIEGIAFDGDQFWIKYVEIVSNDLLFHNLNFDLPLSKQFVSCELLPFEDLLHLLKCLRYRLVCGSSICPWITQQEATINIESLKSIGIKKYVLDPSQSKKMDDKLPLLLFNFNNIAEAIRQKRYDIMLALLPATLLLSSVFSQDMTREKRLKLLSIGFAIVHIYYSELCIFKKGKGKQTKSRMKGRNLKMMLYDRVWCKKFISLTYSLSSIISDPRSVQLGACGTHFLEHFFGLVRKLSKGDDSAKMFEKGVDLVLIKKVLKNKFNVKISTPRRLSDSGARLYKVYMVPQVELSKTYLFSYKLISLVATPTSRIDIQNRMKLFENKADFSFSENNFYSYFMSNCDDKIISVPTLSSQRNASAKGYNNFRRIVSGSQVHIDDS